ncbi:DegQ family serine endoprotease [Litorivicinus sp.]|nr:DegQ family serine endoprotease [Litorivicinus sp.]
MKLMMQVLVGWVLVMSLNARAQLPEFTELVDDVAPAVVNISTRSSQSSSRPQQTPDLQNLPPFFREFFERGVPMPPQEREGRSLGSGFIISKNGYVLTNNHVIEGAETVIVRLNDRREFIAEVVGTDPRTDVAVLKLDATDLPVAKIADSDDVTRGQWVVAIGSPFGFDYSVTAGIVSATGRALPDESYVPFIQTDVAINPGNSGGPLFNLDGEVVGINSQIFTRSGGFMGLSFAIPMNLAMNVAEQIQENGVVRRGWLGVLIQEVNRDLALSFGLDKPMGALIAQASSSGPGGKAGIQPGDIIVRFNGKDVERSSDLPPMVGLVRPGTSVPVDVVRQGDRLTIDVMIEQLPEANQVAQATSAQPKMILGMTVDDVPESLQSENNLQGGILVKEVGDDPALSAGLRAGDIITQVGGREISGVPGLQNMLDSLPTDRPIPVLVVRGGNSTFLTLRLGR